MTRNLKKAGAATQPPRRGRPPGRTAQQEKQRQANRAAIVAAAAGVFATKPYIHATIDDIIAAAGISRATFYFHFESKLALAFEIYESIAVDWLDHFDRLKQIDLSDVGALTSWTRDLVQLYVDHGYVTPLVEQLAVFEGMFRQKLQQDIDRLIVRLADDGIAGCVRAVAPGPEQAIRYARVQLLMKRLDQLCGTIARGEATLEPEAYLRVMAEELSAQLG